MCYLFLHIEINFHIKIFQINKQSSGKWFKHRKIIVPILWNFSKRIICIENKNWRSPPFNIQNIQFVSGVFTNKFNRDRIIPIDII